MGRYKDGLIQEKKNGGFMRLSINGATTMPYSLQEDIVFAHKMKFEGIEIWYDKLKKYLSEGNTPAKLQELLWSAELEPSAICSVPLAIFSDPAENIKELIKAAEIGAQIDCNTIVIYPSDFQPANMSKIEAVQKASDLLRDYAEVVRPYKTKLAFESFANHPYVPGPSEVLEIIHRIGNENVGILIDTYHYYKSKIGLDEIEKIPVENIFLVHINDYKNIEGETNEQKKIVYPGAGEIPLFDTLKLLKAKDYKGFVSVEVMNEDNWKESPEKILFEAKKSIDELMGKI